ncbi:uncharacterized protein BYT42DRAFT_547574 [Radiomyces spectabilis]|uniref:uncharacterized protein n=1 Tax=Radiomyces spectabilis TaxID=64574 RepID=UPI00221EE9F8|nr:uncharacterized protein BYT42DRAFT_547574 [Radiomyces spectabilis]KAI8374546.1 hypothetical protein BYT42DRAFT_547574 [Radiomyces spectabilis]
MTNYSHKKDNGIILDPDDHSNALQGHGRAQLNFTRSSLIALASLAGLGSAALDTKRAGQGGEPLSDVDAPVYTLDIPYNAATSLTDVTWETITVQPTADIPKTSTGVIMAPLSSKGDQFYYQGGLTCPGCPTNPGYVFDLNQKSWRKVNDEPLKYGAHAHLVDDAIYYYGGYNSQMQFGNATKPGVNHQLISIDTKTFAVKGLESITQAYPPGLLFAGSIPEPDGALFAMIGGVIHNHDDIAERRKLVDMVPLYANPFDNSYLQMVLNNNTAMPEPRLGHTLIHRTSNEIVLFGGCNLVRIDDYMVVLFGKNADGSYVNDPVVALDMQTWEWTNELRLGTVPTPTATPNADGSPTNGSHITDDATKEITAPSGLGGGAIAGITVGAVAGVAVIAAAGWFMYRRKQPRQGISQEEYISEALKDRHYASYHGPDHGGPITLTPVEMIQKPEGF